MFFILPDRGEIGSVQVGFDSGVEGVFDYGCGLAVWVFEKFVDALSAEVDEIFDWVFLFGEFDFVQGFD